MTGTAPAIASRRRYLAILFADLSGSTRIAGSMEFGVPGSTSLRRGVRLNPCSGHPPLRGC